MSNFERKLKGFLHDPIDKVFNIKTHEKRAKEYAEILGVKVLEEAKGQDHIASCMERSLLPKDVIQNFNEIRHPLSEGYISSLPSEDFDMSNVKSAYYELGTRMSYLDDKKKFLFLWRNLMEKVIEKTNSDWKKFIPLLPADTRVPDHSIWEHLKISSCIFATEERQGGERYVLQNNSLFLFTIGPVQAFVSEARKTQDLYMGSLILSYLTFWGMTALIDKFGPTSIIYPDLYSQPFMDWYLEKNDIKVENSRTLLITIPTIPNRFVAIIPVIDKESIKEIGNDVTKKIKDKWDEIGNFILEFLKSKVNKDEIKEGFERKFKSQLSEFPKMYWTSVPWKIDGDDVKIDDFEEILDKEDIETYKKIWEFTERNGEYKPNIGLLYGLLYTALEKSIGTRKNLRDFNQFSEEERGRKCSLCGKRDVLFYYETKNKNKFKRFNKDAIDLTTKIPIRYLSDGEGLCGICFVKRTFDLYLKQNVSDAFRNITFPSTSEVATSDFKDRILNNEEAKVLFNEYVETLIKEIGKELEVSFLPKLASNEEMTKIDGEWFFEENLIKEAIWKNTGKDLDENKINILKERLKKITDKVGKPNPYYAVIKLDGDNMGKWLSGELLPKLKNAYNSEVWENKLKDEFKGELTKNLKKKIITPAIHASISNALRNYSLEFVRKIVEEEHLGKLVYAGGDDVLAFVNVRDLLPVMRKLRGAFSGHIKFNNGKIEVDWENDTGFVEKDKRYYLTMGKNATASMGVVIAHYKMPLKVVLDKAGELEEFAKDIKDKDAFAIGFYRHSGESRVIRLKWRYGEIDTIESMIKLKEYFTKKDEKPWISKRFIRNFEEVFDKVKEENGHFPLSSSIFESELRRLFRRGLQNVKSENKEELIDKILEKTRIKDLFWKTGANLAQFLYLLEICAFLSSKEEN